MLLLIMAAGFLFTKMGMFSAKTRGDLTNIVIYLVLPCNIFGSFHKGISPEILRQCVVVLFVSFGMHLLYFILSKVLYIHFKPEKRVVAQYATIINNSGFMGLPVMDAVFGQTGLLYGSVVLIPMRVFMWTAGLSLFTKAETGQKVKTLATHPCIWAVILGFAYIFAPFELPLFIRNSISAIGGCTTALSMLVIGSILTGVDPRSVKDIDCFYYTLFRLIVIPAIVFGALLLLKVDPLVTGVAVLASAMPSAVVSALLAEKYGQDTAFASKIILVSTTLSIITLPVISMVLTLTLTN